MHWCTHTLPQQKEGENEAALRGKTAAGSPARQPVLPGAAQPAPAPQPLSSADKIRGWQSHPPVCCAAGSSHPSDR